MLYFGVLTLTKKMCGVCQFPWRDVAGGIVLKESGQRAGGFELLI